MTRKQHRTRLTAPFLRRIAWADPQTKRPRDYPFSLPWLRNPDWEMQFDQPVTIITGENGAGKSTLIEAIAALAGYDEAGGGKGYRPVDHSGAVDTSGSALADHLRAAWLPKVTAGWFFKAETFWAVARYLDSTGGNAPDFLSHSHGEGFLRVFAERIAQKGFYLMDEPESALSPESQLDLVARLARIQQTGSAQVILATHSPILMAVPGATLLHLGRRGLEQIELQETRHFRLYRSFCLDPAAFIADGIARLAERQED
jgi:predicted ATPase